MSVAGCRVQGSKRLGRLQLNVWCPSWRKLVWVHNSHSWWFAERLSFVCRQNVPQESCKQCHVSVYVSVWICLFVCMFVSESLSVSVCASVCFCLCPKPKIYKRTALLAVILLFFILHLYSAYYRKKNIGATHHHHHHHHRSICSAPTTPWTQVHYIVKQ